MSNITSKPHDYLLLHLDLTDHTEWLKSNVFPKHLAKKELGVSIIKKLEDYQFKKLFWNGDGGVFFVDPEGRADYDFVVDATDNVYELFENWKTNYRKLEPQLLVLRVCADVASIFTDVDTSFWTSRYMNLFIKFERKITEKGFAIGEQIKDKLTSQKQHRFDGYNGHKGYKRQIGIKDPTIVWYDSTHSTSGMDKE